jgi:energy-coupling factor transport system substrate-specific component
MGNPWHLRDYVFAAFMTIGMVISVAIVGPFVPPGFQLLAWAPLGGIFLTLGMARLQRRGSVALMILPLALLLGLISPIMTLYLAVTVAVTEGTMLVVGNYRRKINRLIGNGLFFASANLGGLLLGAYLIKGHKADSFVRLVTQPVVLLLVTLLAGAAGVLGWWLGELAIQRLKKAGKMDVDL